MIRFLQLTAAFCVFMFPSCVQQQLRVQARESRVVVLDIGHYYHPQRGGQGARTPDARYGNIEECEFWYKYAIYTKRVIEQAGYTCRICNRGATPANPALAACGRSAGVHQINTPEVTAVYRSKYHPNRMAVGILSADYGIDQKPGCIVFLHHNSETEYWQVCNKGAIYCNERGTGLAKALAREITSSIYAKGMNNNGVPCGVIIRNDGRRGGGDWLNTCNEHYVPAAITEAAYLSNPDHARFLGNNANAIRYAQAVGRGIVNFMQSR